MNRIVVRAQTAGQRGLFAAPLEVEQETPAKTVQALLASIVAQQVAAFVDRKREAQVLRFLTQREIEQGREAGRIAAGDQEPDQRVPDVRQSIEAAVTAFEDGLYYMFINGNQIERLDQALDSAAETDVLFVRLTPLAGG